MKVRVFTLPWQAEGGGFDDSALAEFLTERTALEVSEHFFIHENTPVLVLVVRYRGETGRPGSRPDRGGRSGDAGAPVYDAAAELSPEDRRRFEALRAWRNEHARAVGRPPYAVFTNRQAAELARARPQSLSQLAEIKGLGPARVGEFGAAVLALLAGLDRSAGEGPADG